MPDRAFAEPRLAEIYDALDPDRDDLEPYTAIITELAARSVVDVGCGTGELACRLASVGVRVTGLDPAVASLEVAARKRYASNVRWVLGEASELAEDVQADVATMTGNVAQAIVTDEDWSNSLGAIRNALRPGGALVFETRDPGSRAWKSWNRAETYRQTDIPTVGVVDSWCELLDVDEELVSLRWSYRFHADGDLLTSDSTLRFRSRNLVEQSLAEAGFTVDEVRDAPDRPGREFVFIARTRP